MIRLDPPRRVCGVVVAAIVRQRVNCVPGGCTASKAALALLIATDHTLQAFDPQGRPLTDAAVDRLLPGARHEVAALCASPEAAHTP